MNWRKLRRTTFSDKPLFDSGAIEMIGRVRLSALLHSDDVADRDNAGEVVDHMLSRENGFADRKIETSDFDERNLNQRTINLDIVLT